MTVPLQRDPYEHIRYTKAFDQEAIYKKHRSLIDRLGCSNNVFTQSPNNHTNQPQIDSDHVVIDISTALLELSDDSEGGMIVTTKEVDVYVRACLQQLNHARRMALAQPGIYALTEIGLMGCGAALATTALGQGSMGGSIAVFVAIFDSLKQVRGMIQSGHNLMSWPDNPLDKLEETFAKNKLYIPRVLWQAIIHAFISARQNEFSREKHTNFIDFALGLTIYKPKPKIKLKDGMTVEGVKAELNSKIDTFFSQYDNPNPKCLNYIKINLGKFIDLITQDPFSTKALPTPRYLYLQGLGGIGKTLFVLMLSKWLEEMIPGSVQFDDLVVNSAEELEGNDDRPGVFLRVLRNQLTHNKIGSMLIIDEATWLNNKLMISPAKRVFNGDCSKLSTTYFGKSIDGSGLSLKMPPMLIFVASNERITDSALRGRFDIVDYPTPTLRALINYAQDIASKSSIVGRSVVAEQEFAEWVERIEKENLNFRYIAGDVESFVMQRRNRTSSPRIEENF